MHACRSTLEDPTSKRGWTTWLTSAIDPRVAAAAPMVIDMLNMGPQLRHQKTSLGDYSGRISDYTERSIPDMLGTAEGSALLKIVDPYSYRDSLALPKLIILGTNDGFWSLDSLNLYWDDLPGEKYVTYVPNADHDLGRDFPRVLGAVRALHRHATNGEKLPGLSWDFHDDDAGLKLTVTPGEVGTVQLWSADAPTRNFHAAKWAARAIPADATTGAFAAAIERPAAGYRAAFAEVVYPRAGLPLHLSTTLRVLGTAGVVTADAEGE